jgi:septal ring-binding cell division protein DamX
MVKKNDSGEKKRRGFFQRLIARPFLVLGWIAAGLACLILAVFVFYPHRNAPLSLLSALKTGPKIFHKKIPEEIKIAQKIFRGKIPAVDQPVKTQTKIESIPPFEKKTLPFQSTDAAPEKIEPLRETALFQPEESQTEIETTPLVAQAKPFEPNIAPPEQIEPRRETALPQPMESPIINETILPAEEQSVSSQPTVAPSEQRELPEIADLRQAKVHPQPVKEDVIQKTEERIIHSEKWLLSQESSFYTIQLMGARKKVLLFNFVEKNRLLEQNEIAFYQTTFKDKPWLQLLYGVYATKKDAQAAADNLPPKIRKSSPWIRRLSSVQKAIRRKAAQ